MSNTLLSAGLARNAYRFWWRAYSAGWSKSALQSRAMKYALNPDGRGLAIRNGFPANRFSLRKVGNLLALLGHAPKGVHPYYVDEMIVDALARGAYAVLCDRIPAEMDKDYAISMFREVIREGRRVKDITNHTTYNSVWSVGDERHLYIFERKVAVDRIRDESPCPGSDEHVSAIDEERARKSA